MHVCTCNLSKIPEPMRNALKSVFPFNRKGTVALYPDKILTLKLKSHNLPFFCFFAGGALVVTGLLSFLFFEIWVREESVKLHPLFSQTRSGIPSKTLDR